MEILPGMLDEKDICVEQYDDIFLRAKNINITDEDLKSKSLNEFLNHVIYKSLGAATAQGSLLAYLDPRSLEKFKQMREDAVAKIASIFSFPRSGLGITYREWHEQSCNKLLKLFSELKNRDGSEAWTYGNSQKIVNLLVKYLVVCARRLIALGILNDIRTLGEVFLNIIGEVDIPVDSLIIEAAWNHNIKAAIQLRLPYIKGSQKGKYTANKVKAWSKWNKEDYDLWVSSLHHVFVIPLNWEGYAWAEVKNARSLKVRSKKIVQD